MLHVRGDWTSHVDGALFVPGVIYVQREPRGYLVPVSRAEEPDLWAELVASGHAIATKLEPVTLPDGTELPLYPVSSTSAPSIMNIMLDELQLEPGMRVLEIGTGTGWNAAIMAEAGADVTTVEIYPDVADHARAALKAAGYPGVRVVTGDGELGVPEHAPYDRLIATASAAVVPYPWVAQVRDGGRMVFPYTGQYRGHGLGILTVRDGVASGEIASRGEAGFMALRGRRLSQAELRGIEEDPGVVRDTVAEHGQRITASG